VNTWPDASPGTSSSILHAHESWRSCLARLPGELPRSAGDGGG
jgi:hypothetical protein